MAIGKGAIGDLAIGSTGVVDSPSGNHSLTPSGLVAASPVLGTPAISAAASNIALTAAGIATGNPVLAAPVVAQQHGLAATTLATAAPTLGVPALTEIPAGVLSANGIASGAPLLGVPALAQAHVLSAGAIAAGDPAFGQVTLAQQHAMMAGVLATAAPVLGLPTLTETAPGAAVWPAESAVRLGVTYGPTGVEYTGAMEAGTGVYPTAESIASAVLAALQSTTIPVDVTHFNGNPTQGSGRLGDPVRPL